MDDKLKSLIIEKGGQNVHVQWVNYFMLEPFHPEAVDSLSPTDHFLSIINYKPITNSQIFKDISKSKSVNQSNIIDFFCKYFKSESFDFSGTSILAQMSQNQLKEGIQTDNESLIRQYVFRGFIHLILTMPKILNKSLNSSKNEQDDFDWSLAFFMIKYLSSNNNPQIFTFYSSLEQFIKSFSNIIQIISLPHDSPLFKFFTDLFKTLVFSIPKIYEKGFFTLIGFCSTCFTQFLTLINSCTPSDSIDVYSCLSNDNPVLQNYSVFLKFLIAFKCEKMPDNMKYALYATISTFLDLFEKTGHKNLQAESDVFSHGIDSIQTAMYLANQNENRDSMTVFFFRGVMHFLNWYSKRTELAKSAQMAKSYEEPKETLAYQMPQNYFFTHRVVELHKTFFSDKKNFSAVTFNSLIQVLKDTLATFELLNLVLQSITLFFSDFSEISLITIMVSFPYSRIKELTPDFQTLIELVLKQPIFDRNKMPKLSGIDLVLFDYSSNIILTVFDLLPECRLDLLNLVFDIIESQHLTFLSIMPVLRSLLLLDSQNNFISYLLNSNFLEIVRNRLHKTEYETEIDSVIAFLSICINYKPVLTMSSYELLSVLMDCVTTPKYTRIIMKCIILGLSQNSQKTITCLAGYIAAFLLKSVENQTEIALAAEFIDVLSQTLYHYSLSIMKVFESSLIFDSISRFPLVTHDRSDLLRVLNFFLLLIANFPLLSENLDRKHVYTHIKESFQFIPIDDEILMAMFSLVMGLDLSIRDTGLEPVKNIPALKFVISTIKESSVEYQLKLLKFLVDHCSQNEANCFSSFQAGILEFLLECMYTDELCKISLELFKKIASIFFSSRDLRFSTKTLFSCLNNKELFLKLIGALISIIEDNRHDNVTPFFHFHPEFSEPITASIGKQTSIFSSAWIFSTTFSIAGFGPKVHLFTIKSIGTVQNPSVKSMRTSRLKSRSLLHSKVEMPKTLIDCCFNDNHLAITIDEKETKQFQFTFNTNYWYIIRLYVNGKDFSLYIDNNYQETLQFSEKFSYSKPTEMLIGGGFYGDIGNIYMNECQSMDPNQMKFDDDMSLNSTIRFLPRNVNLAQNGLIETGTESCTMKTSYVPFKSPFKDCVMSPLTFSLVLPLLNHINDSEILEHYLLFFKSLLLLCQDNEKLFEDVGGFQLFIGLIKNPNAFSDKCSNYLYELFLQLTNTSLKLQMIEYFWFRFSLISKFSDSFMSNYYSKILNPVFHSYQGVVQISNIYLFSRMLFAIYAFNLKAKPFLDLIYNHLNDEFRITDKIISLIELIYLFSNNSNLKAAIIDFFTKIMTNNNTDNALLLRLFSSSGRFFASIFSNNENEQKVGLNYFIELIKLERNNKIKTSGFLKSLICMAPNSSLCTNMLDLFNKYDYDELLFLFCCGVPFSNEKEQMNEIFKEKLGKSSLFASNVFSSYFILAYCIQDFSLWDTFTSIFIQHIDLLTFLMYVIDSLSLFLDADYSHIKTRILTNVLRQTHHQTKKENMREIISLSLQAFCYRFTTNDTQTNSIDNSINKNEIPFDQFKNFLLWNANGIDMDKSFAYEIKFNENNDFLYSLFQVLADFNEDTIEISSSTSTFSTFSMICIIISILIEKSNDSILSNSLFDYFDTIDKTKEQNQINLIHFAMTKSGMDENLIQSKYPNSIADDSLKVDFINFLDNELSQFNFDMKIPFNDYRKQFPLFFKQEPISQTKRTNFKAFLTDNQEKIEFQTSFLLTLSKSFLKEAETFDSSTANDTKFKISNEIDQIGQKLYMSINRNFNDHQIASKKRDSIGSTAVPEEDPKGKKKRQQQTALFKQFLDRSMQKSLMTSQEENTLKAVLITISARYDVTIKFDKSSIVLGGKLSYDGFGTKITNKDLDEMKMEIFKSAMKKFVRIDYKNIAFIFNRRYLHEETGCEIFTHKRKSYLLYFSTTALRNEFYNYIKNADINIKSTKNKDNHDYDFFWELRRCTNSLYQTMNSSELFTKSKVCDAWLNRLITNYQYLFYLNILSGRSFNDISQYPVYPWILSRYDTDYIDLEDVSFYRDLSLPMGAIDETRLNNCKNKMKDAYEQHEKCLYRVFFSNAAVVVNFLMRTEPFTSLHIRLQSGQFDCADRIFGNIQKSYEMATTFESNYSELTPEFFSNWHFLKNENGFNLGICQNGDSVNDVVLPSWAENPCHFIQMNRNALDSEYVRMHLNEWIDLIFGVYQKSVEKNNLFHLFTYNDCIANPDFIRDSLIPLAQHHAQHFGVSPEKILSDSHPIMATRLPSPVKAKVPLPQLSSHSCNSSYKRVAKDELDIPKKHTMASPLLSPKPSTFEPDENSPTKPNLKRILSRSSSLSNLALTLTSSGSSPNTLLKLPKDQLLFLADMYYLAANGDYGKIDEASKTFERIGTIFDENHQKSSNENKDDDTDSLQKENSIIQIAKSPKDIFLKSSLTFVYVQSNRTCAVAVPLHTSNSKSNLPLIAQRKIIMHKSSPIWSICQMNQQYIVTGGSDCCLNVWNASNFDSPQFDLVATIPILAQRIMSVSGNLNLDRIVAIDEVNQIFIVSLVKQKLLFSFNAVNSSSKSEFDLDENTWTNFGNPKIFILNSSLIALTSENTETEITRFDLFDLTGVWVSQRPILFDGEIVKIIKTTKDNDDIVIISMTTRKFYVINCSTFSFVQSEGNISDPELICLNSKGDTIIAADGTSSLSFYPL